MPARAPLDRGGGLSLRKFLDKYHSLSREVKAALWFLACGILQKGIGVIVTPIFTRLLSTDEYGLYTLFDSWLNLLSVVLTLRLSYGVFMQGLIRYDRNKDEYTSALMGLTTLCVLIGLCIYLPAMDFWNGLTGLNTFLMLCLFVAAWAVAMFDFWSTRQRVAYNYRLLVAVTLLQAFVAPVAGVVAVISTEVCKVEARVFCLVAVEMLIFVWMFVYYMRRGRCFYRKDYWLQALKFNVPLVPHYLSQTVLSQADRVMISSMVSRAAAGIYGLASSLSGVMNIVSQAILNSMNPWLYQKIKEGDTRSIARVSYAALALIGGANLVLIAFAPEVIALFAPPEYAEAALYVPALAGSMFVTFMYSLFADFEFYYEKTGLVATASIVGALVNVALNWVFIPLFGALAASFTTLISYLIYVGMHYVYMRRVQRDEMGGVRVYDPKVLLAICGAFALGAAALVLLYQVLVLRVLCVAVGVGVLWAKRRELLAIWSELKAGKS